MDYSVKSNDRLRVEHSDSLHFRASVIAAARSASRSAATIVAVR